MYIYIYIYNYNNHNNNKGITTCKFSESNPNLIAAGTYDGVVAIYDIRRKEGTPVA
jgi:WD40 repeat protein